MCISKINLFQPAGNISAFYFGFVRLAGNASKWPLFHSLFSYSNYTYSPLSLPPKILNLGYKVL